MAQCAQWNQPRVGGRGTQWRRGVWRYAGTTVPGIFAHGAGATSMLALHVHVEMPRQVLNMTLCAIAIDIDTALLDTLESTSVGSTYGPPPHAPLALSRGAVPGGEP